MRRDKARTRERIIGAAIHAFAQKGVEAVSLDEIAGLADVSRGTLYNHFPNRDAILRHLAVPVLRRGIELMRDCEPGIKGVAEALYRLWMDHGEALSLINSAYLVELHELSNLHNAFVSAARTLFQATHAERPMSLPADRSLMMVFASYPSILESSQHIHGASQESRSPSPGLSLDEFTGILNGMLYWSDNE